MSVKVTTPQESEQQESPFPKIMISKVTGSIWLVSAYKKGTCLYSLKDHHVGEYSSDLMMDNLTDYNEPITLQND
jgi:hypothetical protein